MKALPHTEDVVTTPPTIDGDYGRAWLFDTERLRKIIAREYPDTTVATWMVEAPWAHPLWHSYFFAVVHLRPVEGLDTRFYIEGATHELWLYALDPAVPRQPMLDTGDLRYLHPANFAAQIIVADDTAAAAEIRHAVDLICAGRLSPDTDFKSAWISLFNDSMVLK